MENNNGSLKSNFEKKGNPTSISRASTSDVKSMPHFNALADNLFSVDMKIADYNTKLASGTLQAVDMEQTQAFMAGLEATQSKIRAQIGKLHGNGDVAAEDSKKSSKSKHEQVSSKAGKASVLSNVATR